MDVALENGMKILQDIDALVRKCEQQDKERVNRLSWLRRAKRASKLQTALRVQKSSFCNAITIETLYVLISTLIQPSTDDRIRRSSAKNGLTLEDLHVQIQSIAKVQDTFIEKQNVISSQLSGTQRTMEQVMEYRRSSGEFINSFPEHETKLMEPDQTDDGSLALTKSHSISRFNRRKESGTTLSENVSLRHHQLHIQDAYQANPFRTSSKSLRYQPLRCLDDCSCRCHQRSVVHSPRNLSNFLGDVFLGCSSLPWCFSSNVQCNEQSCKRSQCSGADLRYFFPQ